MKGTINGEPFDFDMSSMTVGEVTAIEKALGCSFGQWQKRLEADYMDATQALLWIIFRRQTPDLRFDDPKITSVPITSIDIDAEPEPDPTTAPTE